MGLSALIQISIVLSYLFDVSNIDPARLRSSWPESRLIFKYSNFWSHSIIFIVEMKKIRFTEVLFLDFTILLKFKNQILGNLCE